MRLPFPVSFYLTSKTDDRKGVMQRPIARFSCGMSLVVYEALPREQVGIARDALKNN